MGHSVEPNVYIERRRKTLLVLNWPNQRAFRLSKTKFVCRLILDFQWAEIQRRGKFCEKEKVHPPQINVVKENWQNL